MANKPVSVSIWLDGSVVLQTKRGGWAAVLVCGEKARVIAGREEQGTNNGMETLAVLKALECLTRPCMVTIYTDSQYVEFGFQAIAEKRKYNTHVELWEKIKRHYTYHTAMRIKHVIAHTRETDTLHRLCDYYARRAAHEKIEKEDYYVDQAELIQKLEEAKTITAALSTETGQVGALSRQ